MTSAPHASTTYRVPTLVLPVLSLLLLPALARSQGGPDPTGLGYESAVESHRGFDAPAPPDGTVPAAEAAADVAAEADPDSARAVGEPAAAGAVPDGPAGVTRAGDRSEADAGGETTGATATTGPSPGATSIAFDSVLDDYVPYEESDGPNWIEANEVVGEIGGWRTYARELFESTVDEGDAE